VGFSPEGLFWFVAGCLFSLHFGPNGHAETDGSAADWGGRNRSLVLTAGVAGLTCSIVARAAFPLWTPPSNVLPHRILRDGGILLSLAALWVLLDTAPRTVSRIRSRLGEFVGIAPFLFFTHQLVINIGHLVLYHAFYARGIQRNSLVQILLIHPAFCASVIVGLLLLGRWTRRRMPGLYAIVTGGR
jgi:hypothetical protein